MHTPAESPRDHGFLPPETSRPIFAADEKYRLFEGACMHKRGRRYYCTCFTSSTHYLVYAIGDGQYGRLTYESRLLEPVSGWTTHVGIVQYEDRWFWLYHDSEDSGVLDWLRQVKVKRDLMRCTWENCLAACIKCSSKRDSAVLQGHLE